MSEITKGKPAPIAVIKVGGDMVEQADDKNGLAANIKDLLDAGWHCVVLHGAGPQLTALQKRQGLTPNKIDGRRVTSVADLDVVKQALCGQVNVDLVTALLANNVPAFGCHGASGRLIQASKRPPIDMGSNGMVDFGEVGDVEEINTQLLETLLRAGQVPVIASLGVSQEGRVFNINADTTVAAVAKALRADMLVLSTKIGGIFQDIEDPSSRIAKVTPRTANDLIQGGVITDGMIPKVSEALQLLRYGVSIIAIANALERGSFLHIAKRTGDVGTLLVSD